MCVCVRVRLSPVSANAYCTDSGGGSPESSLSDSPGTAGGQSKKKIAAGAAPLRPRALTVERGVCVLLCQATARYRLSVQVRLC